MQRLPLINPELVSSPFDHDDWVFEIKYDGFRAAACLENGKCELVSRNDRVYSRYDALCRSLAVAFDCESAVFDGELAVLDERGVSQFQPMMFNREPPIFAVFDVLVLNGEDLRDQPLIERKRILRETLRPDAAHVLYVDHVQAKGKKLFDAICALDMEGIVAKPIESPYRPIKGRVPWWKIRNPAYSQAEGRGEMFNAPKRAPAKRKVGRAKSA